MKVRTILVAIIFLIGTSSCWATSLIFERVIGINRDPNIFSTDRFDLDLSFGDSYFSPSNPVVLFDDTVITPADESSTLEVTSADPGFAEAVARLTDGDNEFVHLTMTEDVENGRMEQRGWQENFFFLGLSSQDMPDLAGSALQSISLHIDQFHLNGSAPSGPDPPVDLQLTISFVGAPIPEPLSLWLLLCGIATLKWTRGRKSP